MSESQSIEELVRLHWGLRSPYTARQVRDEPYRRTWWMQTRDGTVMIKWFGDPGRQDAVASALRLCHWVAEQGAPFAQLIPPRTGPEYLRFDEGICAMFEYIDGAVGISDWRSFGRALGRLHTVTPPEFAERSPVAPRTALVEAHRNLRSYLELGNPDEELTETIMEALYMIRELPVYADLPSGLIHADLGIAHTVTRITGEITFLDTLDIGIGPFPLDFTHILCEHLSHLDTRGMPQRLDIEAAREFFGGYEILRTITVEEFESMLQMQQVYTIARAARLLDQSRRSQSRELMLRGLAGFGWLGYVKRMVENDLPRVFNR